eukprot:1609474-Ditylum_brightwellii.AAC.1
MVMSLKHNQVMLMTLFCSTQYSKCKIKYDGDCNEHDGDSNKHGSDGSHSMPCSSRHSLETI